MINTSSGDGVCKRSYALWEAVTVVDRRMRVGVEAVWDLR